jgi:hypothetical protein
VLLRIELKNVITPGASLVAILPSDENTQWEVYVFGAIRAVAGDFKLSGCPTVMESLSLSTFFSALPKRR